MRTVRSILLVGLSITALLLPAAAAAEEPAARLSSVIGIQVKPGHDRQFREGATAWKTCYLKAGGESAWDTWHRVQGAGNTYVLTFSMADWASLDDGDEAGRSCQEIIREQIQPHTFGETTTQSFAESIPRLSRTEGGGDVVWVTNYRVNNGRLFMRTIEQIVSAVAEAEGQPRGYWFRAIGGGPDSPDYYVVSPHRNFAALDEERDGIYALVEKARGEAEAERLLADMITAIDSSWSYLYRRIGDLSRNP